MLASAPILNRELVAFLRRGRAFWGLLGFLVLLCFFFAIHIEEMARLRGFGTLAYSSRKMFFACAYVQMAVFFLSLLLTTASSVSAERRKRTFDLLVTAPLSARAILLGKALASVGYLAFLLIASIPVYSLGFLFGGVRWWDLGLLIYTTFLMAATYAVVGVAYSAMGRRKTTEKDTSPLGLILLLYLLAFFGVFLFLVGVFQMSPQRAGPIASAAFFLVCPFGFFYCMTTGACGTWVPLPAWALVSGHTILQVGLLALFLKFGSRALRKDPAVVRRKPRTSRVRLPWLFPIPDWVNPVAAKDVLLALPKGKIATLALSLLFVVPFGIGVWLIWEMRGYDVSAEEAQMIYDVAMLATVALVALMTFMRAGGVMAQEAERGTWGLLAATAVSPFRVAGGKLVAVIVSIAGSVTLIGGALLVFYCLCFPPIVPHVLISLPLGVAALVASSAFYGSIGIRISSGARTVRAATNRVAIAIALAAFFGLPFFMMIVSFFEHVGGFIGDTVVPNAALSVLFPALFAFLPGSNLPGTGEVIRWLLFPIGIVVSLTLAWLWLRWAGATFDKRVRKG